MATNQNFNTGHQLSVTVTNPATPKSGDPVRYGAIAGVALTDERADGKTTVRFSNAVFTIPVKGVNAGGNSAVAEGDDLFYVDGDSPPVSKKVAGTWIGTALAAVTGGATTSIRVRIGR